MLLYPLAMAMILPALCSSLFKNRKIVYQMTTLFTVIPAALDGIKSFTRTKLFHFCFNFLVYTYDPICCEWAWLYSSYFRRIHSWVASLSI